MTNALLTPSAGGTPAESDQAADSPESIGRVVLIDSRDERRAIMNSLIERCPRLTVVGLAENLGEAEAQVRDREADVALIEIQMPVDDGIATIEALRRQFPELRIVVCSFRNDAATRERARLSGADSYLNKPVRIEDLLAPMVGPKSASSGPTPP